MAIDRAYVGEQDRWRRWPRELRMYCVVCLYLQRLQQAEEQTARDGCAEETRKGD